MTEDMGEQMAVLVNAILAKDSFREAVQKYAENLPQKDFTDMVVKNIQTATEEAVKRQMQAIVAEAAAAMIPHVVLGDDLSLTISSTTPEKPGETVVVDKANPEETKRGTKV